MKCLYLFALILIFSYQGKSDKTVSHKNRSEESIEPKVDPVNSKIKKSIVDSSIGIVSVTDKITKEDTIRIFNKDGSLWYKFSFFYDDSDNKFDYPNNDFKPLAFHPDNFLLMLKVTDRSIDRYEVIVNEKSHLKKYIKKDQDFLLFQSWKEHILSLSSVDFNETTNPILEKPFKNAGRIYYDNDELYRPNQIKGEWLQLKWGSERDWKYGWIRWKDNEKLLIELYYLT